MGRSILTQPSADGPSTMPTTISRTTDGSLQSWSEAERQWSYGGNEADNKEVVE